jgi:hypothetical protein
MSKYLCIADSTESRTSSEEKAIVRIPLALIRAGVKLGLLVPPGTATRLNEVRRRVPQVNRLMAGDFGRLMWTGEAIEVDTRDGRRSMSLYLE